MLLIQKAILNHPRVTRKNLKNLNPTDIREESINPYNLKKRRAHISKLYHVIPLVRINRTNDCRMDKMIYLGIRLGKNVSRKNRLGKSFSFALVAGRIKILKNLDREAFCPLKKENERKVFLGCPCLTV